MTIGLRVQCSTTLLPGNKFTKINFQHLIYPSASGSGRVQILYLRIMSQMFVPLFYWHTTNSSKHTFHPILSPRARARIQTLGLKIIGQVLNHCATKVKTNILNPILSHEAVFLVMCDPCMNEL
jgi:hypothetical protein